MSSGAHQSNWMLFCLAFFRAESSFLRKLGTSLVDLIVTVMVRAFVFVPMATALSIFGLA